MRALFKGKTYRLVNLDRTSHYDFLVLCNAINKGRMDHVGCVSKHELGRDCTTPQVYQDKELMLAATIRGNKQFINEIWVMSDVDMVSVPVPPLQ